MNTNTGLSTGEIDVSKMSAKDLKCFLEKNYQILADSGVFPSETLKKLRNLNKNLNTNGETLEENEYTIDEILLTTIAALSNMQANIVEEHAYSTGKSDNDTLNDLIYTAIDKCTNAILELDDNIDKEGSRNTDLQNILSQIKSIRENVHHKDTIISKLLEENIRNKSKLAESFNLPASFDFDEMIEEIKLMTDRPGSAMERIAKRFGIEDYKDEEDVLSKLMYIDDAQRLISENARLIQEKVEIQDERNRLQDWIDKFGSENIKFESDKEHTEELETQNLNLLRKISEVEEQYTKLKNERDKYRDEVYSLNLKKEELQMEIEDKESTLNALNALNPRNVTDVIVAENYTNAINLISNQVMLQSEELEEARLRIERLTNIINKQFCLLDSAQEFITRLSEDVKSKKSLESLIPDGFLSKAILNIAQRTSVGIIDSATRIADSPRQFDVKVIQLLQCLFTEVHRLESRVAELENIEKISGDQIESQLHSMVQNLLGYLENISQSDEALVWLYPNNSTIGLVRSRIIEATEHVKVFLESLNHDIKSEVSAIDFLSVKDDLDDYLVSIKSFFELYEKPHTRESKLLLDVLRDATVANYLLKKLAQDALAQVKAQQDQIENLKVELHVNEENLKYKYEFELKEANERIENAEKKYQSDLLEIENQYKSSLAHSKVVASEDSKINELEGSRLDNPLDSEEAKYLELLQSPKGVNNNVGHCSRDYFQNNESNIRLLDQKDKLISEMQDAICILKEDLKEITRKYNSSIDESYALKSQIAESKRFQERIIRETHETIEAIKQGELTRYNGKLKLTVESEATKRNILKDRLNEANFVIEKLKKEVAENESKIAVLEQFKEKTYEDQRLRANESRKTATQQKEVMNSLTQQIKELTSRATSAEIEAKMLQARLKAVEDKQKRDKQLFESQASVRQMTAEGEAQTKIAQIKKGSDEKVYQILSRIVDIFKDAYDLSQPITESSAMHTLEIISSERQSAKNAMNQVEEIRRALNLQSNTRICPYVTELSRSLSSAKKDINSLQQELTEVRLSMKNRTVRINDNEWECWARRIWAVISDDTSVLTKNALRMKLEEKLMAQARSVKGMCDMSILPESPVRNLHSIAHAIASSRK